MQLYLVGEGGLCGSDSSFLITNRFFVPILCSMVGLMCTSLPSEMLNLWYNQGQLESEMNIPPQKNANTLKFHFILEEALRLYVTCQKTYALPSRISYLILSVSLSSYHQLCIFLIFFSFIFISWRLISLQHFSGFCHTLTWISHVQKLF